MTEALIAGAAVIGMVIGTISGWRLSPKAKPDPDLLRRYTELNRELNAEKEAHKVLIEENQNLKTEYQELIEYRAKLDLRLARLNSYLESLNVQ